MDWVVFPSYIICQNLPLYKLFFQTLNLWMWWITKHHYEVMKFKVESPNFFQPGVAMELLPMVTRAILYQGFCTRFILSSTTQLAQEKNQGTKWIPQIFLAHRTCLANRIPTPSTNNIAKFQFFWQIAKPTQTLPPTCDDHPPCLKYANSDTFTEE